MKQSDTESRVFIALGSNLGDRKAHLIQATQDLSELPGCSQVVSSSIYETTPMGPQEQPDYLNSVCSLSCMLEPIELLHELKRLERQHGRTQSTERWTARPLDLDILLFAEQRVDSEELVIPHPGIADRSFVLWPLAELDESLIVPGLGPVAQLMKKCERFGIRPADNERN